MDALSTTFFALADPTRRALLARLAQGDATVGELGRPFAITAPAISRHLRVLEGAGLVGRTVDAQRRVCHLQGGGLAGAGDWLDSYRSHWDETLDRLVAHLENPPENPPPKRRRR